MAKKEIKKVKEVEKVKALDGGKGARTSQYLVWVALALTFFAFLPALENGFVNWDDPMNIYENSYIKEFTWENIKNIFSHNIAGGYNPLSILSFAVEHIFSGEEGLARLIHTDNVLLHLVVVFLAFKVSKEMGLKDWACFFIALFFGIHPMRVESVAWATERKDVLMGVFYFWAILKYIRYIKAKPEGGRIPISVFILFVFAIFSKVQSVALPLSFLAFDLYFKRSDGLKLVTEKWMFWLGSLIFGVVTFTLLVRAGTITDKVVHYGVFERFMIASYSFVVYCGKFVYPYLCSALYTYPAAIKGVNFYLSPLLVVGAGVLTWFAYKRDWKFVLFGVLFFFFNYVFVSQIVGAGQGYLADRFTYIPYFGFWVLAIGLLDKIIPSDKRVWATVALGGYAAVLSFMTYQQSQTWFSGETMWSHALKYQPNTMTSTAYQNRGIFYREHKNMKDAKRDFLLAISKNGGAASMNSLGKLYFDSNPQQVDSAMYYYNSGIGKDSTIAEIWANRGAANGQSGNLVQAMYDLNKAVALDSNNTNAYKNRSLAFQTQMKFKEALEDDLSYLKRKNDDPDMWYDAGLMKRYLNRCSESIGDFDRAIQLNASMGLYYLERGRCYFLNGNKAAAKTDILTAKQKGVRLSPQDEAILN
jgi:protein O-mannosyl-transferase